MVKFHPVLTCLLFVICWRLHHVNAKRPEYLLNKPQCTEKSQHKIELLVLKLQVFGPNGRRLPETFEQTKPFCRETARMVNQLEAYFKDCYEKTVRDYANIVMYTIKSNLRKFCGKKGGKLIRQFIQLGSCANKYIQKDDHCLVEFTNKTAQLINIADDKRKFPHLCCNFVDTVKCAEDFLNTIACIRPYVPSLLDLFRAGTQSMIDLVCNEYNDQTDACARLGPPPKPIKPNRTKYQSVALALVELLASIKDPENRPSIGL